MGKFIDLTGLKFGKLSIIDLIGKNKHGKYLYSCKCDCGKQKLILGESLVSGNTKSCGCFSKNLKHGYSETPTYKSWTSMIQRCNNPNNDRYKDWGERGITVCERWLKFENFLEDMGERPKNKTLDRTNNDLGYFKENCKWSTTKEQSNNKRKYKPRIKKIK